MTKDVYCAIDLGATSGRVIIASAEQNGDNEFPTEEVYRFPNQVYEREGKYFWDTDLLLAHIKKGLTLLAKRKDIHLRSIGVDSWGVDMVFIGSDGKPSAHPRAYRDPYTMGRMEEFWQTVPREQVYKKTGIQMLNFNTLYQLYACRQEKYEPMLKAKHYLFISDYISYCLTGNMVCEYTMLSTSQLLNPLSQTIDRDLVEACGADINCFPPIVFPRHRIGLLKTDIALFGYDVPVVAVASHDTASAVASVPRGKVAYLSSGTWSLMGVVTDKPVITDLSYKLNFTNEGGVDGTTRLLKNITGMWILEQCRKQWKKEGKDYSFDELNQMAEAVDNQKDKPLLFNPDDPRFANPESMLDEVSNGQSLTDKEIVWTIYHSLAHRYGEVFRMLQQLTPYHIESLYIIGGGARNKYLNRLTGQAVGVPVVVGSTEATSQGNISVQHSAYQQSK